MKLKILSIVLLIIGGFLVILGIVTSKDSNEPIEIPKPNDEIKQEEPKLEIVLREFILEDAGNSETSIKFMLYNSGEVPILDNATDELYIKLYENNNLLETFPYMIQGLGIADEIMVETVRPIDYSKITRYEITYLDKTVELVKDENMNEESD